MKIGIITIWDDTNYGNRLQNFAMQKILSNYGDVFTLRRDYPSVELHNIYLSPLIVIKNSLKKTFTYSKNKKRKVKAFKNFDKKIQTDMSLFFKRRNYSSINDKYNFFVAGSDQIWNPTYYGNNMFVNCLGFAPGKKRIAISPSISLDNLENFQIEEFKKFLFEYKYISCREQLGAKQIESIVKCKCDVMMDPTLMIESEMWDSLAIQPKFHKVEKYILMYFLGNITEKYERIIKEIKNRTGLTIINILDENSMYYTCGPENFIWLIKNSELVITDSFHGTVFSYIFDKPFRVFMRNDNLRSMNSRIESLLQKLNISNDVFIDEKIDLEHLFITSYDKNILSELRRNYFSKLDSIFNCNK